MLFCYSSPGLLCRFPAVELCMNVAYVEGNGNGHIPPPWYIQYVCSSSGQYEKVDASPIEPAVYRRCDVYCTRMQPLTSSFACLVARLRLVHTGAAIHSLVQLGVPRISLTRDPRGERYSQLACSNIVARSRRVKPLSYLISRSNSVNLANATTRARNMGPGADGSRGGF